MEKEGITGNENWIYKMQITCREDKGNKKLLLGSRA